MILVYRDTPVEEVLPLYLHIFSKSASLAIVTCHDEHDLMADPKGTQMDCCACI